MPDAHVKERVLCGKEKSKKSGAKGWLNEGRENKEGVERKTRC